MMSDMQFIGAAEEKINGMKKNNVLIFSGINTGIFINALKLCNKRLNYGGLIKILKL